VAVWLSCVAPPPPHAEPTIIVDSTPEASSASAMKEEPAAEPVAPVEPVPECDDVAASPDTVLEHRASRLRPRRPELVLRDLSSLEPRLGSMHRRDPYRPGLIRQVAEAYVELAAAYERDRASDELVGGALDKAIPPYEVLVAEYPKWCHRPQDPPTIRGCPDEVLYYLALAYDGAGKRARARELLLRVVRDFPTSAFVPAACVQLQGPKLPDKG
jgi:hypothetical protein